MPSGMEHVRLGDLVDLAAVKAWKVGAGDGKRAFPELCRQWDVFAAGPGEPGPFVAGQPYLHLGRQEHQIRRLYEEVSRGDVVVLRVGKDHVEAVRLVGGDSLKSRSMRRCP